MKCTFVQHADQEGEEEGCFLAEEFSSLTRDIERIISTGSGPATPATGPRSSPGGGGRSAAATEDPPLLQSVAGTTS